MSIDKKVLDALSSMIYVSRVTLEGGAITEDDQKIRASGLYADWTAGSHTVGEVFNTHKTETLGEEWEQTWECFQDYDNAVYPDIAPGNSAWHTFNRPLHGKTPETARPWVQPQYGTTDMYKLGEYMIYTDGLIYECVAENGTSYSPEEYAAAWAVYEG